MALNMDAILRVVTQVKGTEQLNSLGQKFNGLQSAAQRLTSAGGLLGGVLGSLAPLASIAGLTGMVKKTIDAADQMHNLSMRTGVSVENLGKLNKAAKMSGTDIETVSAALNRLSKAMVASISTSRYSEMTKDEADQAIATVREGERAQTRILKDQADERINALEKETDRRLDEISKRYRREEQLINDNFDDALDREQRATEARTDYQLKQINRFYEAKRKAVRDDQTLAEQVKEQYLQTLEDQETAATNRIRDAAAEQTKARQRANRDNRQATMDRLEEDKDKEIAAFKGKLEQQKSIVRQGLEYQTDQIRLASEKQQEIYRNATGINDLSEQMEEMGLSGKAASQAFLRLGVNVKDAAGQLRNPYAVMIDLFNALNQVGVAATKNAYIFQLLSKAGTRMGEMIAMGGSAIDKFKVGIDTSFANLADKYKDDLIALGGQVGRIGVEITKTLLPALSEITPYIIGFVKGFNDLPGPLKQVIGGIAVLAVGLSSLSWLLLPIVALFTGPAGLAVGIGLAVVAIAGLAYAFRDKLGELPGFLWQVIQNIVNPIGGLYALLSPIINKLMSGLGDLIKKGVTSLWGWLGDRFNDIGGKIKFLADSAAKILGGIGDAIKNAFMTIPNMIRGAINAALSWAGDAVNRAIGLVNGLIQGVNRVASAVRLPSIPTVPTVPIPQFATGAYVTGRTTATIGEGGQPEYVIPADRMATASTAYLQGARGVDVLSGRGGASPSSRPAITIQTGPVQQQPDGSQWVTLADLEATANQVADQLWEQFGSPAGRLALGGA